MKKAPIFRKRIAHKDTPGIAFSDPPVIRYFQQNGYAFLLTEDVHAVLP
jgi:hypothetical protein